MWSVQQHVFLIFFLFFFFFFNVFKWHFIIRNVLIIENSTKSERQKLLNLLHTLKRNFDSFNVFLKNGCKRRAQKSDPPARGNYRMRALDWRSLEFFQVYTWVTFYRLIGTRIGGARGVGKACAVTSVDSMNRTRKQPRATMAPP